jgi:hypothetical protein
MLSFAVFERRLTWRGERVTRVSGTTAYYSAVRMFEKRGHTRHRSAGGSRTSLAEIVTAARAYGSSRCFSLGRLSARFSTQLSFGMRATSVPARIAPEALGTSAHSAGEGAHP